MTKSEKFKCGDVVEYRDDEGGWNDAIVLRFNPHHGADLKVILPNGRHYVDKLNVKEGNSYGEFRIRQ